MSIENFLFRFKREFAFVQISLKKKFNNHETACMRKKYLRKLVRRNFYGKLKAPEDHFRLQRDYTNLYIVISNRLNMKIHWKDFIPMNLPCCFRLHTISSFSLVLVTYNECLKAVQGEAILKRLNDRSFSIIET